MIDYEKESWGQAPKALGRTMPREWSGEESFIGR